jgi:glycosyltransferase involved in cell wall biosynthesis
MNQTVSQSEIEIIVVDDGSRDDSVRRIQAIKPANLYLIQISNHGASYARNVGTEASSGQFIQYLDADDFLFPNALELRRNMLVTHSADVAYGRYRRLVEQPDGTFLNGEVVGRKMEEISLDSELAAFSSFWVPPVALMYRKEIVKKIGVWNRTLPVIQDARFLQDAAHFNARFIYVPEVLGSYRVHLKNSLSKNNLGLFERDILKNAFQTENRWRKKNMLTPAKVEYLAVSYKRSAEKFMWHEPARFRFALHEYRRLRKRWEIGFVDLCGVTQSCFGLKASEKILWPIWFGVRCFRFLGRRLKRPVK